MSTGTAAPATLTEDDEDTTTAAKPRYEFDAEFQAKITALVLRDTMFAQLTDGLVSPEYFEDAAQASLVALARRYYEKYKKAPGDTATLAALIKDSIRTKLLTPVLAKLAITAVPDLYKVDISDRDYVADQVAEFARNQALSSAILTSVDLMEKRDFDGVMTLIAKAAGVGKHVHGGNYDYGSELKRRTQERLDRAAGILAPTGITTGFKILDGYLYHKGWGRKEMSVLMGGPKAGKSMAMINFGINAIANGYRVLYVTLEVAKEIIAERMDANIAERAINELGLKPHEVAEKVEAFMAKAAPFRIEEFPSGTFRASDLRRLIEKYKSQGMVFDLVIVDYADLMRPERVTDNVQENSKSVYVDMRGIAMLEGFALLTATQTNREGAKKAVATMTDVAEDLNKVRIADIVLSINVTDEERTNSEARIYFAACRNQRSGFSLRIKQNVHQGKFIVSVVGEE